MTPRTKATPQQLAMAVGAGHLDGRTHTGRTARPRTCPTCHARVLVGDDNHIAALTATVDPQPLTLADEALTLATGRRTYTVRDLDGARPEITHRVMRHAGMPAPQTNPREYQRTPGYTVHAEHTCNARRRMERTAMRNARRNDETAS